MTSNFLKYLDLVSKPHKTAVKITILNPDETVRGDITNQIYDISGTINVNYQNGARRSCTLKINNDRNANPINIDNFWFGQKFKLWVGLYLDDTTPFYFPQGVYYITSPTDIYNPNERTITLQGVDKWAAFNGTVYGNLSGTYQTNIGNDLFDATRQLLRMSKYNNDLFTNDMSMMLDPISPLLSSYYLNKYDASNHRVLDCPYTATVEAGQTLANVLEEYATILSASIYYDADGRLNVRPLSSLDNFDDDKQIIWDFSINKPQMTGLTTSFEFEKVYNDFIILGNIANGYQAKARVQNNNPMSEVCIDKIGMRTKRYEDAQYYTDDQCVALGKEYAKQEGMLARSISIPSTPLYHLDVDKIITVATPKNDMKKEKFLIKNFSLPISGRGTMNIEACNIHDINNFNVITL